MRLALASIKGQGDANHNASSHFLATEEVTEDDLKAEKVKVSKVRRKSLLNAPFVQRRNTARVEGKCLAHVIDT